MWDARAVFLSLKWRIAPLLGSRVLIERFLTESKQVSPVLRAEGMATGAEMRDVLPAQQIEGGLSGFPGERRTPWIGPSVADALDGEQCARRNQGFQSMGIEGEILFQAHLGGIRRRPPAGEVFCPPMGKH